MLIIVKNGRFFAGVEENEEVVWTPIEYMVRFPCQIILFPTMDMAMEDQENLELGGEIVPLGRILSITPS